MNMEAKILNEIFTDKNPALYKKNGNVGFKLIIYYEEIYVFHYINKLTEKNHNTVSMYLLKII